MFKGFREFVMRGNVVDMAVGIIVGAAFGRIITSLVGDVIMPPLGLILGKADFASLFISLDGKQYASLAAAKAAGAPVIAYGSFINTIIDFLIVAFVIFLVIQQFERVQKMFEAPAAPTAPTTKDCEYCKTSIPISAIRCPNCTSNLAAKAA